MTPSVPDASACAESADEIARRSAERLWQEDHAAQALGVEIVSVTAGRATLRMTIRQNMVNGHGSCHGGYLFAIADTAFAYACNSFNQRAVAGSAEINFLAPAQLGDTLTATGFLRQQGGRSGVYDVEVSNQQGDLLALFRGCCVRIRQTLYDFTA